MTGCSREGGRRGRMEGRGKEEGGIKKGGTGEGGERMGGRKGERKKVIDGEK